MADIWIATAQGYCGPDSVERPSETAAAEWVKTHGGTEKATYYAITWPPRLPGWSRDEEAVA